jgi:hypothetical protein
MIFQINGKALLLLVSLAFAACNNEKEDVTNTVNKNGSVETVVHIGHLDSSRDELVTTHKVWVKQNEYKTIEYRDTIPALGVENTVAENNEGETRSIAVPKEYEIYITVK